MVEHVEYLRLNRVEVGEGHDGLEAGVVECSDRQRLKVKKLCNM